MPPRQVGARLARVLARAAAAGAERGRAAPPELRRRGGRAPGRPGLHADGLGLAGAAVVPVGVPAEGGLAPALGPHFGAARPAPPAPARARRRRDRSAGPASRAPRAGRARRREDDGPGG